MSNQPGFFDVEEGNATLSASSASLERFAAVVNFEIFRPVLEAALVRSDRSRGGRPPYDVVLMFRILVLQALYSLLAARPAIIHALCGPRAAPGGAGCQDGLAPTASNSSRPEPSRG
jgi:hypothetical protein